MHIPIVRKTRHTALISTPGNIIGFRTNASAVPWHQWPSQTLKQHLVDRDQLRLKNISVLLIFSHHQVNNTVLTEPQGIQSTSNHTASDLSLCLQNLSPTEATPPGSLIVQKEWVNKGKYCLAGWGQNFKTHFLFRKYVVQHSTSRISSNQDSEWLI